MDPFSRKAFYFGVMALLWQWLFPQYACAQAPDNQYYIQSSMLAVANLSQPELHDPHAYIEPQRLVRAEDRQPKRVIWMEVTAYSSTVDQCDSTPFITANGSHVKDGIVAANSLPFGTKVRIPGMYGDKIFSVEDRMNKKYDHRLDIWMETRQEAKQFGVRYLQIEIY